MKKKLSMLLAASLILLALAGCGLFGRGGGESVSGDPGSSSQAAGADTAPLEEQVTVGELWAALEGYWTSADGYVQFFYDAEIPRFKCGTAVNSDSSLGIVEKAGTAAAGSYLLSIHFEMDALETYADQTLEVYLDFGAEGDDKISVKLPGGGYKEYSYAPNQGDAMAPADGITPAQLWELLEGYWVNSEKQYAAFLYEEEEPRFQMGVWEADGGRSPGMVDAVAVLSEFSDTTYEIIVQYAAEAATEQHEAYEATSQVIIVDFGVPGDNTISLSTDGGALQEYTYTEPAEE